MLLAVRFIWMFAKIGIVLFLLALIYQVDLRADIAVSEKGFDDSLLDEGIRLPDWFKLSFLDIKEDVEEAKQAGKKGLILYFGMNHCPYCKALIEKNFSRDDITRYTRKNFDVVAINVKGSGTVKALSGEVMSEQAFSIKSRANFTPTLIFYDNAGNKVLRLVGYYGVYKFRAALEYVADSHYKQETFKHYLARGKSQDDGNINKLNYRSFAMKKPYRLGRKNIVSKRPLLVMFEQGNCHACDVLHQGVLNNSSITKEFSDIDVVQLNISRDTPVITPDENKTSANKWAEKLNIFYTPTLIFYSEAGDEILRLGSVAHFNRLNNVMKFIKTRAYRQYKNYAEWIYTQ